MTKVYSLLLVVAKPLDDLTPLERIGGVALADILIALMIIMICFIAGIFATGKYIKKINPQLRITSL